MNKLNRGCTIVLSASTHSIALKRLEMLHVRQALTAIILVVIGRRVAPVLYATECRTRMINVLMTNECVLFTKTSDLRVLRLMKHIVLSDWKFDRLLKDCEDGMESLFNLIYPGTRWCGPGNNAVHYDDLGIHREVDECCRAHDFCPKYILTNQCKCNICNRSYFTCSHCECDEEFMSCLKGTNSLTATAIGLIYFRTLGMRCFEELPGSEPCSESCNDTSCAVSLQRLNFTTDVSLYNLFWEDVKTKLIRTIDDVYSALMDDFS